MKSFAEWRTTLEENAMAIGISTPTPLGLSEKKKMFGDNEEEVEDDGGEMARPAEPKDKDIDADDDDDECSTKMCKKQKKAKKEHCGDDDDMKTSEKDIMDDDDDDDDDEDMNNKEEKPMFAKKKQKKAKKEGYNPNETEEEFLASLTDQLQGVQKERNHDGISEYLEDAVFTPKDDNTDIADEDAPEPGQVGFSPYSRIGELGGTFEKVQWEALKNISIGIRPE